MQLSESFLKERRLFNLGWRWLPWSSRFGPDLLPVVVVFLHQSRHCSRQFRKLKLHTRFGSPRLMRQTRKPRTRKSRRLKIRSKESSLLSRRHRRCQSAHILEMCRLEGMQCIFGWQQKAASLCFQCQCRLCRELGRHDRHWISRFNWNSWVTIITLREHWNRPRRKRSSRFQKNRVQNQNRRKCS